MSTLLFCTYSSARYRSSCVWLKAPACAGNLSVTLLDAERTALCFSLPLTCNTLTPTQFPPFFPQRHVCRPCGRVLESVTVCFFHLSRRSSSLSRLCSVGTYSATEFVTGAFLLTATLKVTGFWGFFSHISRGTNADAIQFLTCWVGWSLAVL